MGDVNELKKCEIMLEMLKKLEKLGLPYEHTIGARDWVNQRRQAVIVKVN